MEYELKYYYRIKYALVCARQSFLKEPSKDYYEEYARKVIGRTYLLVLNKIDELNSTNYMISSEDTPMPKVEVLRNDCAVQAIRLPDGNIMAVFHSREKLSVGDKELIGEAGTILC